MPKFSGPLQVGAVAEAVADVSGTPKIDYEWTKDGAPTKAVIGSRIKPSASAEGATIRSRLRFTWPSGEVAYTDWTEPAIVGPAEIKAPAKTAAARPRLEKIVAVSSTADLVAAVRAADLGTVIEVTPGDYGGVDLGGISKSTSRADLDDTAGYVWLRPKDRMNPPRFTRLFDMSGASGLWVDGLWFDGTGQNDADSPKTIVSDTFPKGGPVSTAKGVKVQGCDRITVTNCLFQFHHIGLECSSPSVNIDLRLIGNEWIGCGMDTVRAYCTQDGFVLRNNLMHKSHIDLDRTNEKNAKGAEPRHLDYLFQMDIIGADQYTRDVVIQYNWSELTQLKPGGKKIPDAHSAFVGCTNLMAGNAFSAKRSHYNHLWDNNYIMCSDISGLAGQGFDTLTISRNVFRAPPGLADPSPANTPNIYFTSTYLRNITVSDNVSPTSAEPIFSPASKACAGEVKVSGGIKSDTAFPVGWEPLSKSSRNPKAPDGTCGRYRIGWAG